MTQCTMTGPTEPPSDFHALDIAATLARVGSPATGLTSTEATARLERDGPNALSERGGASWLRKLAQQFVQPLVLVLLGAAGLSVFLGDFVDAAVIASIVVINGLIGFFQEYRAEQSIAALSKIIVTEATVLRDGRLQRIPSAQLVRGDVVALQSGDTVPADLRLLEVKDLEIEEAGLTGESVPARKREVVLDASTGLSDRENMAHAGSAVTYGIGRGVVVATGDATETGRIAGLMAATAALETPLTRRIAQLSRMLVWVILGLAVVLLIIELWRGAPLAETFNAAVALAVGAIPEGLPAAVTILLAFGVSSMAKRGALIRRLPAVETLGCATVICTDKTGTLTTGVMKVRELWGKNHDELLYAAAACCDAELDAEERQGTGDPTEVALLLCAAESGIYRQSIEDGNRRVRVNPFDSERKRMSVLRQDGVLYVKGAVESLLPLCVAGAEEADRRLKVEEDLARQGLTSALNVELARTRAKEMSTRRTIEQRRVEIARRSATAQLAMQQSRLAQLRTLAQLLAHSDLLVGVVAAPRSEDERDAHRVELVLELANPAFGRCDALLGGCDGVAVGALLLRALADGERARRGAFLVLLLSLLLLGALRRLRRLGRL